MIFSKNQKRKILKSFLALFFIFSPAFVHAKVVVNEIAWMGTESSANDEWIELKNTGAENVDLTGWKLEAQDGSPNISLEGSISAGGYFLLERSDDATVPDVAADQIYSGALSNSGEILILKDSSGAEMDRVDGSDNWSIGGDNTTKDTAQKIDSGWVTAKPTPKAQNNQTNSQVEENTTQAETTSQTTSFYESPTIKSHAGENIIAEAGQQIFFDSALSEGDPDKVYWYMGNGDIKDGKSILYTYKYPGVYLVTLFLEKGAEKSMDQIDVTIYPAGVYISEFYYDKNGESWIELYNDSDNFIDISYWNLINENEDKFTIPENTFISGHGYLVLPASAFGGDFLASEGEIMLLYPNSQTADDVSYSFSEEGYSASRKSETEFVLTKDKTPGFRNITATAGTFLKEKKEAKLNTDVGISKNLISKSHAYFVKVGGVKSFLAEPAYAKVTGVEEDKKENILNLNANASGISVSNLALVAILFFAFFAGFYIKRFLK